MTIASEALARAGVAMSGAVAATYLDITVPVFGVPLNVFCAALLGAAVGMAWNDKEMTRKMQWGVTLGALLAGTSVTAVGAWALLKFKHITIESEVLAPVALLIALFGNKWITAVNERIGPWLDRIPFIGKRGD